MPGISAYSESVTGYRVLPYITKNSKPYMGGRAAACNGNESSLAGVARLLALGQVPIVSPIINVGSACTPIRGTNSTGNESTAGGHYNQGSSADRNVWLLGIFSH
jgi:hypothetical protein